MSIHELKLMNFEEAVDLIENRLVEIQRLLDDNTENAPSRELSQLADSKALAETHLARLREAQTAKLSGERDNLFTEVENLLDQIGKRISDLFPSKE